MNFYSNYINIRVISEYATLPSKKYVNTTFSYVDCEKVQRSSMSPRPPKKNKRQFSENGCSKANNKGKLKLYLYRLQLVISIESDRKLGIETLINWERINFRILVCFGFSNLLSETIPTIVFLTS